MENAEESSRLWDSCRASISALFCPVIN